MNVNEAFSALGIPRDAKEEEITKAYRKLVAKLHPDKQTDPVKKEKAEEDLKRINQAYEVAKNPPQENSFNIGHNPFGMPFGVSFNDIFNAFGVDFGPSRQRVVIYRSSVTITFDESITGCEKTVKYAAQVMCDTCGGKRHTVEMSCMACAGTGKGPTYEKTGSGCIVCGGRGEILKQCTTCSATGVARKVFSEQVRIPPNAINGSLIQMLVGDQSAASKQQALHVQINIKPDPDMEIINNDIISVVNISLLEALEGVTKDVKTTKGSMKLKIKPGTKNKDQQSALGYGFGGRGNHIFVINVAYPDDIDKLVKALKEE